MRIAVEGCSHGCLDQIYSSIFSLDRRAGKKTSLLLLCGDVQTLRNQRDMHCLAVPDKHKQMGDFHRYYSGQRKAPILTIMIGGNHEASNYLWELYHGGWVAPNIYYLGAAGCVNVGGLPIAGISGIYKSHDYTLGRHEQMPYNPSTVRSIYHTRHFDTYRLHLLSKLASLEKGIVMSHDWPNTIEQRGDVQWLKKRKPFFVEEIDSSTLGSPPLWKLLRALRPRFWFSAHLHVRFAALYKHDGGNTSVKSNMQQGSSFVKRDAPARPEQETMDESVETMPGNSEEMTIDLSEGEEAIDGPANPEMIAVDEDDVDEDPPTAAHSHSHTTTQVSSSQGNGDTSEKSGATRFLALSKCLQGQDFLQILEVPAPFDTMVEYQRSGSSLEDSETSPTVQPSFEYNLSWLAVTKATHDYLSLEKKQRQLPEEEAFVSQVKEAEDWMKSRVVEMQQANDSESKKLDIERTQQFVKTAPAMNDPDGRLSGPPPWYTNPQTVALCSLLGIENRINPPPPASSAPPFQEPNVAHNGNMRTPFLSEEEEIKRIEEAAQAAMKRKKSNAMQEERQESEVMTLLDDDEASARWKEGSG